LVGYGKKNPDPIRDSQDRTMVLAVTPTFE
jgi:hypothetical protein